MATATTELCIALNDMQEMLNRLEAKESGTSLMNDLHLENFFMCLDGSNASGLGNQARVYVKSLVDNAVEDVRHKIVVLTEQLGQNVRIKEISAFENETLCDGHCMHFRVYIAA